jgi:hypothetical protein
LPLATGDVGELGFNLATPAVPASATDIQNTFGVPVIVYITGAGTNTAWAIRDVSGTQQTFALAVTLGQGIYLPTNAKIQITYTVAPTWKWYGLRQTN